MTEPKWMPIARSYMGTAEVAGPSRHNPKIVQFFADSGHAGIKDDETAWCAAFANAVLKEAGITGTGALNARSFLKWGKQIAKPKAGCIVVFKRGKSSWQGHVAFFVKEDGDYIHVLGGNQGNKVSVAKYAKADLLGYRWPSTMGTSRTVAAQAVTASATAGSVITEMTDQIAVVADYSAVLKIVFVLLVLAGIGFTVYARWDDLKEKGR